MFRIPKFEETLKGSDSCFTNEPNPRFVVSCRISLTPLKSPAVLGGLQLLPSASSSKAQEIQPLQLLVKAHALHPPCHLGVPPEVFLHLLCIFVLRSQPGLDTPEVTSWVPSRHSEQPRPWPVGCDPSLCLAHAQACRHKSAVLTRIQQRSAKLSTGIPSAGSEV